MKNYPPQFTAAAVALYQSRPEATIRQTPADLGINSETLRNWVRAAGASRPRGRRAEPAAGPPTPLEARTPPCARRSVSWRKNAGSCGKRRSISPAGRAGEPLAGSSPTTTAATA
ncbi:transposase [Streptomyces sp. ICN903]|uniref:transposase n=1 Tax=Streptomyces sp. ICN903 TaxID=2964654 RepID=UPI0035B24B75